MKLTGILTKKLTGFWLMSLVAVAFIFLFTSLMSFVQLTYKFQQHKVAELESVLVLHFDSNHSNWELESWLPPLLIAYDAAELRLSRNGTTFYQYKGESQSNNLLLYQGKIGQDKQIDMYLALPQPFEAHQVDFYEILILVVGVLAVAIFVRYGYLWFARQLSGVEALSKRSRLILQGKHELALSFSGGGKPRLINRALTRLLEELKDAQKERSRFDKFIRSNTFLDPSTRIGNRLFFKNRLDALSNADGMMGHGVLYLLEMEDLDLLQQELSEEEMNELIHANISDINALLSSQPGCIFARRSHNQFAIVIPQISLKEADQLAVRLLKVCMSHAIQTQTGHDNIYYLGGAYFKTGDDKIQLLEEADMALKAAQLQGSSNWFMYDKGAVDIEFAKGSVRWRSFLESALVNRRFVAFTQEVIDSDDLVHHQEIFTRARDQAGNLVRATLFIPMAKKCGLMPQIERQIIERVMFGLLVKPQNAHVTFCINLSLDSLTSRAFVRWLQTTLLEYRHLAARLMFEVSEVDVVTHKEKLRAPLDMIRKMGAGLSVDHVGLQVVSTQYIKEFHFDQIKLHRSIVRQIHLRPENQLFVRSLIASLYRTEVEVCAEGVEVLEEWQTLKILGVSAAQGGVFGEPVES